jgi:hypothetical protein
LGQKKLPEYGAYMDSRNEPSQDQENLAGEAVDDMESAGNSDHEAEVTESPAEGSDEADELPKGVKERLGRQEKRHQREMRRLKEQLQMAMSNNGMAQSNNLSADDQTVSPYANPSMQNPAAGGNGIDEQIQKAVSYALSHKDREERKAEEMKKQAHVARQYQELQNHLDSHSDKYDDFDDVVRGHDAPFTEAMRDASLLLPRKGVGSAAEVLYKLGKDRPTLERISKLHPMEQAAELVKLSHMLIADDKPSSNAMSNKQMGAIKSNPSVNSSTAINEKTSVGDLRKRMRNNWKG